MRVRVRVPILLPWASWSAPCHVVTLATSCCACAHTAGRATSGWRRVKGVSPTAVDASMHLVHHAVSQVRDMRGRNLVTGR